MDTTKPRRIVTGTDAEGKSYLARVEEVDEVDYGYVLPPTPKDFQVEGTAPALGAETDKGKAHSGFYRIWGADWLPIPLPTDGRAPYFDVQPSPEDTPQALRRASILPPPLGVRIGVGTSPAAGPPGRMHWTDSTDILFVMSGKHGQILDEGEVLLHPGDVLVQNGTNHSHQTVEPAVLGYVTLGAMRTAPHPPIELLNPVSGPIEPYRGGYRSPETGSKAPMQAWQVPGAEPRPYPESNGLPDRVEELERPRRVVTGTNADGRSYWARVEHVDPVEDGDLPPGVTVWKIWQSDRLPDLVPLDNLSAPLDPRPSPEETPEALRRAPLHPRPLGVVATIARIEPSSEPTPAFRRDTMDAVFVMGGRVELILDRDGIELGPGDVLIQNGTSHAWHNAGDGPALLGVASFAGVRYGG
jgi:quercetin dioxygenase-like cupin family protein